MTLPASGIISISQFNTELGQAATYAGNLYWVGVNSKSGSYSMAAHYGEAYYQKTNAGNCNNGNCTSNCNCGNINCTYCTISAINCQNCDTRAWLQPNCNCGGSYNCTANYVSYNCNCDCACNC